MASIYAKRGVLYLSLYQNGKRQTKSLDLPDTAENRRKVKKELLPLVEAEIIKGTAVAPVSKTLGYYAGIFLRSKSMTAKVITVQRYDCSIRLHILPIFGDKPIDKIKVSEIKEWMYSLSHLKGATINGLMNTMHGIFQEAIFDEAISSNPTKMVRRPKSNTAEAVPFSSEEVAMLLTNAEDWLKCFLAISFYTGMRTGEIVGLKWEDIDWNNMTIMVRRTRAYGVDTSPKTESSKRIVPIFDALVPYMKDQYQRTGLKHGYIFLSRNGEPFRDHITIRDYNWRMLLKRCGIPYRRIYDTRSTFATLMLQSGRFSTGQVAKMMGHKNVKMLFEKYAKFIDSESLKIDKSFNLATQKATLENRQPAKHDKIGIA